MPQNLTQRQSRLLDDLPAIYHADPFLGRFLLAFEDILLGSGNPDIPGLEESISNISQIFNPQKTYEDFLPWLASWTAFSMRADLSSAQQRNFIAKIISLYRKRGTKENLIELLRIFTIGEPTINEGTAEFQIGVHSTVGEDTYLGNELPPHSFEITISLPRLDPTELGRQLEITRALIELEKPAHTSYKLIPRFPTMQINVHSTVGVDTILGTAPS